MKKYFFSDQIQSLFHMKEIIEQRIAVVSTETLEICGEI